MSDPHAREVMQRLIARGVDPVEPVVAPVTGPLAGKLLVVTGTLSAPRGEIQARIEAAGGKIGGSVTKKTSYLVAGADTGKTKLEAAEKHGVPVIDEDGLAKLLEGEVST
jgi:DNA ligase (NAD+)